MGVTIGIPFYNAESYLEDAIRSVLSQTYQDWELILIDDGSTDRSLEIAHSVKDSRISVVSDGENRKLAYRLNQIVSMAKNDLIARMDADDLMSPDRLQKQIDILGIRPDIDLVSTGVCSISDANIPLGTRVYTHEVSMTYKDVMLGRHGIVHASILGRTEWFKRNPYSLNEELAEDYELWVRAAMNNDLNVHIIPEPLYYYREMGNVVPDKLIRSYKSQMKIISRYYDRQGSVYVWTTYLLKMLAVYILAKFSATQILLRFRNERIFNPSQLEHFRNEIAYITNFKFEDSA